MRSVRRKLGKWPNALLRRSQTLGSRFACTTTLRRLRAPGAATLAYYSIEYFQEKWDNAFRSPFCSQSWRARLKFRCRSTWPSHSP
jgi:hypothetical protein